jgi:DnaJ-class molecular chaperone
MRVRVNVQIPTKLTEFETDLLTKYAQSRGEAVGSGEHGLFSRIKSAFS